MSKIKRLSKLKSTLVVCAGAAAVFSGVCLYRNDERLYDNVVLPAMHALSPETAHNLAIAVAKYNLVPKQRYADPPQLATNIWGIDFANPVGMAAGFDKDGEAVSCLHDIGFGFVEIGSVTPKPQPGNEKPRLFRLERNHAIINRYGFNSDGHDIVYRRLKELRESKNFKGVVGVNLGQNKSSDTPIKDYVSGIARFSPVADYLVINISSPNTAGLRDWQRKEQLEEMLKEAVKARDDQPVRVPLLVKLSPDLTQQQRADVATVVNKPHCRVDGLIISNTSTERDYDGLEGEHVGESGGLSGRPLALTSTRMISDMYKLTNGEIPIIGVGGVFSGSDAYSKIRAGASLVQMYTAFVYHGPPRITRIKSELHNLLLADGHENLKEAVGKDSKIS